LHLLKIDTFARRTRGSHLVDEILDKVAHDRIYLLNVGACEVVSILVRKRKSGVITTAYFAQALVDFETEIVRSTNIHKFPVSNRLAISSFSLILAHSINSTDAITLKSALAIALRLRPGGNNLVLVASDQRLIRAAQAEGLDTFNPETRDLPALATLVGP
jgi:predicted nucleic acid-binding protein